MSEIRKINNKKLSKLPKKVAIIHKSLWKMRGAERTLEAICEIFPDADMYCLFGEMVSVRRTRSGKKIQSRISSLISSHKIQYSWLNDLPFIKRCYKNTLPLWPFIVEGWDLSEYDLVISSSSDIAKSVITRPDASHICYMYTPMRFIWDQRFTYLKKMSVFKRPLFQLISHWLRIWDVTSMKRVDKLITISNFSRKRIKKYYGRDADLVIPPPLDISRIRSVKITRFRTEEPYVISISAYDENKGAEKALEFAKHSGVKLIMVGEGGNRKKLQKQYTELKNVVYFDWVEDSELFKLIANAKALLFLGVEDFGLVALESTYLGTPVIALNEGGVKEIVKNGVNGYLIDSTDSEEISEAYKRVVGRKWHITRMRSYAEGYSKELFQERFLRSIG